MSLLTSSADHRAGASSPISMSVEEAEHRPLERRNGAGNTDEVDPAHPPTPAIILPQVVSLLTGDSAAVGAAEAFEKWLALVRKRSGTYRCSGFPNRPPKLDPHMPSGIFRSFSYSSCQSSSSFDIVESHQLRPSESLLSSEQAPETSLWERLGQATHLDIDSSCFHWDTLSSLHHTEHTSSIEQSEDETSKALEMGKLLNSFLHELYDIAMVSRAKC